jgi:hypothetical protein
MALGVCAPSPLCFQAVGWAMYACAIASVLYLIAQAVLGVVYRVKYHAMTAGLVALVAEVGVFPRVRDNARQGESVHG